MNNDTSIEELLKNSEFESAADKRDTFNIQHSLTIGYVVDTDDPLQQGRLRIFCPALNDNPKKLLHIPWAVYVSPFAGSINQREYVRGTQPGKEKSRGAIHYGFWGIPEIGAHAVVGCINGDIRRRFYIGCIPNHQDVHTIGHGRFKHDSNEVDGPLTSAREPIEPTYSNMGEAFSNDRSSSEWKTRGADYQVSAIFETPVSGKESYVDDDLEQISQSENDEWVRKVLGEHGYDWTPYKNLGAFLSSRVYGMTTPGFHSITLDDRAFNSRIRIRTTGGHQLILDDTNERIYLSTMTGNSWFEMDKSGNIDMYSKRRLSFYAEDDINFSSGKSIRMKAKQGIFGYAGDTRGQTPLDDIPPDGQIRFHSTHDFHVKSEASLRINISDTLYAQVDDTLEVNINGNINAESGGDFNIKASSNINLNANDVRFIVSGKDVTINGLVDFIDDFVDTYNGHTHGGSGTDSPNANIDDESLPDNPAIEDDETEISIWTNRVPQHEPWPRVLKQDSDDPVNAENDGYLNNVDWIDQFDNVTSPAGREPIGKVEGDVTINRGIFWRR